MKKLTSILITLLLISFLSGCKNEGMDGEQVSDDLKRSTEGESARVQEALGYASSDYKSIPNPNKLVSSMMKPVCTTCNNNDYNGRVPKSRNFGSLGVNVKQGCGYKFGKSGNLSTKDLKKTCSAVNSVLEKGHAKNACFPSNCTTATWLALAKKLRKNKTMKKKMTCRQPRGFGSDYATFIGSYGLKKLIERNKIGQYKEISSRSALKMMAAKGWPKKGDFIQYDRTIGSRYYGHAAQFSHYKKSKGTPTHICFWSSNKSTKGFATKCEKITSGFGTLGVGRIKA